MQDINAWLQSSQNYTDGTALYHQYGKSDFLKKLFAQGSTPFNTQRLVAELTKLAPSLPAIPENSVKIPEVPDIPETDLKEKEHNHKLYLAFQEDNKLKYRQMERNMAMLSLSHEQGILLATAKQILSLHKKIQDNYSNIDFFDEHGYFPFQHKKDLLTDEAQLIYQSLSKARKRLASGKCKNIEKTQHLIDAKMARLAELNGKANNE